MKKECDHCGGGELLQSKVSARGGQGPDLLPGTGWFGHAEFTIQVCSGCGRVYWWVKGEDLEKVKESDVFVPTPPPGG